MKIKISPLVVVMGAALLLLGEARGGSLPIILSAAIIHESGHLIAAQLLKIRIKCIRLDIFGALMDAVTLSCSYTREAVLCISGPLANLLSVALVYALHPKFDCRLFTAASLLFAFINLLPARGFDGGRALSCVLLSRFSPALTARIISFTSLLSVFLLWSASVYFIMRTGAYLSLFIFSSALFARIFLVAKE